MFDLSERNISPEVTTTPKKIGPSTYFIDTYKNIKESYVPFLSNARRGTINSNANTDALYNVCTNSRVKGGSSMANKTARFKEAKDDGLPGPCQYDPRKAGKRAPREIVGRGRVYNCRVPYSVDATGLSIPTHLDENGYWIDENNKLVKIPATKHDDTLGPAYYAAPQRKCYNSERYKGCRWSLSKSKQIDSLNIESTPGPGTYNPEAGIRNSTNNSEDIEYRALARQFSFLPRSMEAQEIITKRNNYPAPCDYNSHIDSFQLKPTVSINPKPFLSATPRFHSYNTTKADHIIGTEKEIPSTDNEPPGPGSYDVKFTHKEKKTFSIMKTPFGSLTGRRSFMATDISPGPASYNVLGPITSKLMQQKYRENPMVPFNKTEDRTWNNGTRDGYCTPSPADYVVEPLWNEKRPADSFQFKSRSKRIMADIKNTFHANAAIYNLTEPFRANTNRRSHYRGHAPFQQSRNRGPLFPNNFGPGPADYKTKMSMGGRGYVLNTTPRFKEESSETPGPATYKIHPTVESSVHKANATHNLRLREFVLHKKIRLPPQETFARWYKNINKRKNLRWFYEYEMSLPKLKDYIKEKFDETEL